MAPSASRPNGKRKQPELWRHWQSSSVTKDFCSKWIKNTHYCPEARNIRPKGHIQPQNRLLWWIESRQPHVRLEIQYIYSRLTFKWIILCCHEWYCKCPSPPNGYRLSLTWLIRANTEKEVQKNKHKDSRVGALTLIYVKSLFEWNYRWVNFNYTYFMHFFLKSFIYFCFTYLRGKTDRGRGKDRDREDPMCWFTPQILKMTRSGPFQNLKLETQSRSPIQVHPPLSHRVHSSRKMEWRKKSEIEPGTQIWNVGIPRSILTTLPNALSLWLKIKSQIYGPYLMPELK